MSLNIKELEINNLIVAIFVFDGYKKIEQIYSLNDNYKKEEFDIIGEFIIPTNLNSLNISHPLFFYNTIEDIALFTRINNNSLYKYYFTGVTIETEQIYNSDVNNINDNKDSSLKYRTEESKDTKTSKYFNN